MFSTLSLDPMTIAIVVSVVVVILGCIGTVWINKHRNRKAYLEGYEWALERHNLTKTDLDLVNINSCTVSASNKAAPFWRRGYLSALRAHDLPIEDSDARELAANPYAAEDNARMVAMSIDNAGNQVSNSIRFRH